MRRKVVFRPKDAIDVRVRRRQKLFKDVASEESYRARKQDVADSVVANLVKVRGDVVVERGIVVLFFLGAGGRENVVLFALQREGGEFLRRRIVKDVLKDDGEPRFVRFDDDLHGGNRRAANLEEVVVRVDFVKPKNLFENIAEHALDRVFRLEPRLFRNSFLLRQFAFVDLAVGGRRYRVDLNRNRRDHVRRLGRADKRVELVDVDFLVAHDVRRDIFAAKRTVESLNRRVFDAGELANNLFNFRKFDAESADLHLLVAPADEVVSAVGQFSDDVPGAIHTLVSRLGTKRIRNKDFRRFFRALEISARKLSSGDAQFAARAERKTISVFVDDVQFYVRIRIADGLVGTVVLNAVKRDVRERFAWSVAVVARDVFRRIERREFFAAHEQILQRRTLGV